MSLQAALVLSLQAALVVVAPALIASLLLGAGCVGSAGGGRAEPTASGGDRAVAPRGVWSTPAALDSLRAGGVAVLGAVQVNEVDQVRPPLIAALDSVLAARWSGIRIVPYARVRAALDDSTARLLLLGYQLHGRAEPLWLGRAADSLADSARYGVLARVRGQRVRTEERETDRVDAAYRSVKIRATILEGDVSLHLYDLAMRGLLDAAEITGLAERTARSDSLPRPEQPPPATWSTPESRARESMMRPALGFPEPPPLARAVADAITVFANSLIGVARP